jgi:hypothetical protein
VGGNTGCVFPNYTPTLQKNTKKYPAAAAYYWVRMEKLASHPGSEQHNKPLHRLADDTKAKENRDKVCMLAVAEWNPHPNADGTSCDEYPFTKSRESGGMTLSSGKSCATFLRGQAVRRQLDAGARQQLPVSDMERDLRPRRSSCQAEHGCQWRPWAVHVRDSPARQ